jgi:hypothetical protein
MNSKKVGKLFSLITDTAWCPDYQGFNISCNGIAPKVGNGPRCAFFIMDWRGCRLQGKISGKNSKKEIGYD